MHWRTIVHRLTGWDMHKHWSLVRGEKLIEITTAADGETLECVVLVEFGEVVDHLHGEDLETMNSKLYEWCGLPF